MVKRACRDAAAAPRWTSIPQALEATTFPNDKDQDTMSSEAGGSIKPPLPSRLRPEVSSLIWLCKDNDATSPQQAGNTRNKRFRVSESSASEGSAEGGCRSGLQKVRSPSSTPAGYRLLVRMRGVCTNLGQERDQ
ncbi:hypothetical protein EYF80_029713 [Liparis tanakae]|uniref:Uncharacterized protein n=1 Tax=Liparis tanakae TaxID=230148 RepID=A0A4Z2H5D7_9TELE|nr:hypothetical protein EYF80_029713 [Liparis tanakae]